MSSQKNLHFDPTVSQPTHTYTDDRQIAYLYNSPQTN